MKVHEVPLPQQ